VLALSRRWKEPEEMYRKWYKCIVKTQTPFALGKTQLVRVGGSCWVANMIAQSGIFTAASPPIRYDALKLCLEEVAKDAKRLQASVHMPRIGCGLAGGTWEEVGPIVQETLVNQDVKVTVYDLE
jgi:hypothetical protein